MMNIKGLTAAKNIKNDKNDNNKKEKHYKQDIKKRIEDIFGSRDRLTEMLMPVCGRDTDAEVKKYRKRLSLCYAGIVGATLLAAVISLIYTIAGGMAIDEIKRPAPGESSLYMPVEVSAEYGGERSKQQIELSISQRDMTDAEIEKEMEECGEYLRTLFEEDESGNLRVSSSVQLPDEYGECGVSISWESSDPVLISEKGEVDVIALAGEEEAVTLTAELSYDGHESSYEYEILLSDDSSMYEASLSSRIRAFASAINDDVSVESIKLPSELADGVAVKWKKKKQSMLGAVVAVGAACAAAVYYGRYRKAKKHVSRYKENVINEFPAVIDKLILLLNSGLTVFAAMMRISDDYEKAKYCACLEMRTEAAEIGRRVRNTNSNIVTEWKDFAGRMESGDMLRFCTILADNINTGSGLVEKLEAESRNLRELRRKEMRKRIHMVDSKMLVPMMIMLFSLILITVAPAIISF